MITPITSTSLPTLKHFAIDTLTTILFLCATVFSRAQALPAFPQPDGAIIPNRLIVVYREGRTFDPMQIATPKGVHVVLQLSGWGIAVLQGDESSDPQLHALQASIAADPAIAYVVHDRKIRGSGLTVHSIPGLWTDSAKMPSTPDWYYTSTPQGWAVKQVGGFGAGVPGGPAQGPWNQSMGHGVRIAVLDSGISSTHPDTAPNLVYAQSLVDQTALPSPCDNGSPEDQDGHGTFVASLAAGALGRNTGMVVGVAPEASLLNIKVLERVPASGTGSAASLCEQGTASGLMSWIIAGIAVASQQHADIISISAGGLLDSYSGESEGLIAAVNRAVYNATQAGSLVIAAAGNDGESLDNNRYVEMPAQAQDALAVIATTNPQCGQNLNPAAVCQVAPVGVPYYSNYGTTLQAVGAPGGSLPQDSTGSGISGFVRGACSTGLQGTLDGLPAETGHSFGCFGLGHAAYVEAIGTSASAPLVAGVAAILKGAKPSLTPSQIITALRSSALPVAESSEGTAVSLVNAVTALQAAGN
jgi:subtilisin family serine protease